MSNEALDETVAKLKSERDELRVRMHLAKLEIKDEYEVLEKKWFKLEQRLEEIGKATKETAGEVKSAAGMLAQEIGAAYKRVRKSMD